MSKVIKIPMSPEVLAEFEDTFVGKEISAYKFVSTQLKEMSKDAKSGKLAKVCTVSTIENGQAKQDQVKLKDCNLPKYHLAENPQWLPKELQGEEVKFYEQQVTDAIYGYLHLFCEMTGFRFEKWNESAALADAERVANIVNTLEKAEESQKPMLQARLDEETKKMTSNNEDRKESTPKCFEEAIYTRVYPAIYKEILENMDKGLESEFEELKPAVAPTPKEGPKR